MPLRDESNGRNLFRTARERERRRARFDIRSHVSSLTTDAPVEEPSQESAELALDEVELLKGMLRKLESGHASTFSIATLAKHRRLFSKPIPTQYISTYRITTRGTSRLGKQNADQILQYVKTLHSTSWIEYAVWLGEYKLVGSLLSGGLDPTLRGAKHGQVDVVNGKEQLRRQSISARLRQRFLDRFPRSLASYMIQRVVDMRILGGLEGRDVKEECQVCALCHEVVTAGLNFGPPCHHEMCENCIWESLLEHVDDREEGDVVLCAVCGASGPISGRTEQFHENIDGFTSVEGKTSDERRLQSLNRYLRLAPIAEDLRKLPAKKKKSCRRGFLCSSWQDAVSHSVGSCQNVRRDKFFGYTEHNARPYVRGCLVEGVDVNMTNEYGQTALYIAAWRGYWGIVELLLHFGADPTICAHGGSSVFAVAKANGREEVLEVLERRCSDRLSNDWTHRNLPAMGTTTRNQRCEPRRLTLIEQGVDHPGAGSFLLDQCVSSATIDTLIDIWKATPVAPLDMRKVNSLCSARSYFCEAEGNIRGLLRTAVRQSAPGMDAEFFPHMRFLHYEHPGSILAPHIDLCRTNLAGQRSTHTFILYLCDCEMGGETLLLASLSGDASDQVLARVSPRRARLLVFPHGCPHSGSAVKDVPKLLLRGEALLYDQDKQSI